MIGIRALVTTRLPELFIFTIYMKSHQRENKKFGYFNFTLAELKSLRKKQANVERDPRYDWNETVVTLDELVEITRSCRELLTLI